MPPRSGDALGSSAAASAASSSVLYPIDTIRDAAEALGLAPLRDNVAVAFAADVEYRLRDLIQEAAKYMRHAKRGALSTHDVELALRARNIEPIYGFLPFASSAHPRASANNAAPGATGTVGHPTTIGPTFRRVQTPSGPIHYIADDEIDFEKILDVAPRMAKGKGVGWEAHWLAIEGVVPDLPQNVPQRAPASTSAGAAAGAAAAGRLLGASGPLPDSAAIPGGSLTNGAAGAGAAGGTAIGAGTALVKPLIKHVLSRELQLYFERLTTAIVSPPASADVEDDEEEEEEEEGSRRAQAGADDPDVVMVDATGQKVDADAGKQASAKSTASIAAFASSSNARDTLAHFSHRSSGNTVRDAGLASLRSDPGLHPLLPYLVQWIGEKVVACLRGQWALASSSSSTSNGDGGQGSDRLTAAAGDTVALRVMLNVIHAMSFNETLYIEPYLHQLLPTVLSVLLCASLSPPHTAQTAFGPAVPPTEAGTGSSRSRVPPTSSKVGNPAAATAAAHGATHQLRTYASALLAHLVQTHARAYPGLRPRIVRTLLKALTAGLPAADGAGAGGAGAGAGAATQAEEEDVLGHEAAKGASGPGKVESPAVSNAPKESPGTKLGALCGLRRIGREAARLALFGPEADLAGSAGDGDGDGDGVEEEAAAAAASGEGADEGAGSRRRRRSGLLKRVGEWTRRYERSSVYGMGQLGRLRVKEEVAALTREVRACIVTVYPPPTTSKAGARIGAGAGAGDGDAGMLALEPPPALSLQAAIGPFWADRLGADADVQRALLGRPYSWPNPEPNLSSQI